MENDLTPEQLQKLKEKYAKDFVLPTNDAERKFAIDYLIQKFTEVKDGKWGQPV